MDATDLVLYGSANRPDDDVSTVGGAVDTAVRTLDAELVAVSDLEAVSDDVSDTRGITVEYRLASGVVDSETVALDGTTPVPFGIAAERILRAFLATPDATATVDLRIISAGAVQHTFHPTETEAVRAFRKSYSENDPLDWYEKYHWRNNHDTDALLGAEVVLIADPSAVVMIALDNAVDGTTTATDRLTAPASGTTAFVDDDVALPVPEDTLGAEEAIGTWAEMALAAAHVALKSSFTLRIAGQSAS